MKKYLPYIALAAVAYFLWKKKAASAGAKPSAAAADSSVVGQLAALFNANASQGKGSATNLNVRSGGGGGSGAGLTGGAINVNGLVKGAGSGLKWLFDRISEELAPNRTTTNNQFIDANTPLSSSDLSGIAGSNAVKDESVTDLLRPLGNSYDFQDYNFDGSNEFGGNFDNFSFA